MMKRSIARPVSVAGAVALGVLLAACGANGTAGGAADGGAGGPKVTITSPADGADVSMPFTLRFTTSVPIGPPDSGREHVHVFTDQDAADYTVVTSPSFTIQDLPPGNHTVGVTLQHADHSPAGASAQITVNVTASGGAGAATTPSGGDSGGSDGGYSGYGGGY
ncbi:hypothetical protein ACQP1V_25185 [Microtetraspora malaysiensis]|uniref:hypothetical protein n=1 Tax=Microtetraspora malaysiensis TaxID=161358 RepID=UPI003D926FFD